MQQFFVITGPPGSGKTSLIDALASAGVATVAEAGRAIIRTQLATGGTAMPWKDRAAFAALMLQQTIRAHRQCLTDKMTAAGGPVLFDRGVVDALAVYAVGGLSIPSSAQRAADRYRYHPLVFLAPYWPAIFTQDPERRQGRAEARRAEQVLRAVYARYGYRVVDLPITDTTERAAFVRTQIGLI